MPLERLGKLRESLTVSSELYKKHLLRYLEGREYYTIKASSDVEATFADAILTRKGEKREYWLEVKETAVSLGDSDFLKQLAKYLAEYLSRTPENRFKMILACYRIVNAPLFKSVYVQFESEAINGLVSTMVELSDPSTRAVIEHVNSEDIKKFFEDTTVKEADLKELQFAQEKITPTPPTKPSLPEAEYASKVMAEFGDVLPLKSPDKISLNIFRLDVPSKIHIAKTMYRTADDIFAEKPNVLFPAFDLDNGQICSFNEYIKENPLSGFVVPDSVVSMNLEKFIENENNENIVIKILNRWIKSRCRKIGLVFNERTKAYYYPRNANGEGLVTVKWKAPTKESSRELTKPMKDGGKINFWIHRSAVISAKNFWGQYYIQIKPRFLFSSDGMNLYDGPKTDKLDRNFRKSKYSHNLNQFYDVLFWYRHVFPETKNLDTANLDICLGFNPKSSIRVLEQINVEGECKPNTEATEDVEELEKIESDTLNLQTLDAFFGE
ncbi:MAG TPA: hypothetical protein VIH48_05495 [Candidatus Bathyarchaeia archaeon]